MPQLAKKLPRKLVKGWSCYQGACADVQALCVALPLALAVRGAPLRDRHWRALAAACGVHFDGTLGHTPPPFPHVPLGALLDFHVITSRAALFLFLVLFLRCMGLSLGARLSSQPHGLFFSSVQTHLYVECVRDVIAAAVAEAKVEASLALIEGAWEHHRLQFEAWGETGVWLPAAVAATVEQLEEHQAQLQATHGSMRAATVSGPVNTTSTDFFKSEVTVKKHACSCFHASEARESKTPADGCDQKRRSIITFFPARLLRALFVGALHECRWRSGKPRWARSRRS